MAVFSQSGDIQRLCREAFSVSAGLHCAVFSPATDGKEAQAATCIWDLHPAMYISDPKRCGSSQLVLAPRELPELPPEPAAGAVAVLFRSVSPNTRRASAAMAACLELRLARTADAMFQLSSARQRAGVTKVNDIFWECTPPSSSGDRSGGGLALAACKTIMEARHGRVWAEPGPGGAMFCLMLPFRRPEPESAEVPDALQLTHGRRAGTGIQ